MAGPGRELIPSHRAGCSDYSDCRCTMLGVGYVGGSSAQPSPSVLNAMSRDSMTDTIGSTLLGETAGSLDPGPKAGS